MNSPLNSTFSIHESWIDPVPIDPGAAVPFGPDATVDAVDDDELDFLLEELHASSATAMLPAPASPAPRRMKPRRSTFSTLPSPVCLRDVTAGTLPAGYPGVPV